MHPVAEFDERDAIMDERMNLINIRLNTGFLDEMNSSEEYLEQSSILQIITSNQFPSPPCFLSICFKLII
jgi:hypothetical protein